MQYFGSKQRIATRLAAFMQPHVDARGAYVEPFVGGAAIMALIKAPIRQGADANGALIALWRALAVGWDPPTSLSESEYAALRTAPDTEPLKAFAGFGCSFAGKWFCGYARSGDRNYALSARISLLKKQRGLAGVLWSCADYRQLAYRHGAVVYLDPPYANTTGYGACAPFDSAAFWEFARELAHGGWLPFVSEYAAPPDFTCVFSVLTKTDIRVAGKREPRQERLFTFAV